VKRYGDDELRAVIDSYGLGDNPALVRFLYKISRATGEDSTLGGDTQGVVKPKGPKKPEDIYSSLPAAT
jgi:hypothetical protein